MKKYTRKEMRSIMEVRGYSPRTIEAYIYHLINLAGYFNKAPHTLTPEHIHKYQVFLVNEKQVSYSFFNQSVCAMKFFLTMWLVMTGLLNISLIKNDIKNYLLSSPVRR